MDPCTVLDEPDQMRTFVRRASLIVVMRDLEAMWGT